ncbi:sulfate transporter [Leifsonia sp. ALI-44-B]|uniref:SulP family inorganic anion transporter n=1 Tax=Leifsonia sp. ALI-44-B TaxID=1933776 RepID=UPI00097BB5BB|nr:SulP family inorganic anion transporter [Leifsonia sp. ALI-44-B]ONI60871.1 sulfate transporter [Leifsonia sp. ALI-44-B]
MVTLVTAAWLFPTLRGYRRAWALPDAIAGLSAGAVVIPQAMAYATIAELPVQVGLYTCIVPLVVYAAVGGSRAMSVTTTSTIATLTATTFVSAGVAASSSDPLRALTTLTLLVGVILILARVLRLGSLVENINHATLVGIKVGLGATVALGQVPKLLGVDVEPTGRGFAATLAATLAAVPGTHLATLLLSVGSIVLLVALRRFAPRVPGPLVVVAAGILLVTFTALSDNGLRLIDPVPTGLPVPMLPQFDLIGALLPGALAIAVMAFLESASVARGIRVAGDPQIRSNRELLATGVTSAIGAFFQSLPAAGGFSQSAVNQRAGAKSQVASLVTAGLAVLVAVLLAPVLSQLPQATLAALVFVAVVGLIDIQGLVRLWRISRAEFWIAALTAVIGLAAGLIPAVAAGVLFTLLLVLRELNRPRIAVTEPRPGVLVVVLESPLYTANVLGTTAAVQEAVGRERPRVVILDASILQITSVTVLDTLADLDAELRGTGVRLEVAGMPTGALRLAERTAWWRALDESGRVHSSAREALAADARPTAETRGDVDGA